MVGIKYDLLALQKTISNHSQKFSKLQSLKIYDLKSYLRESILRMGQGDIGNRGVSLRALGDDLGFKGLGIGTTFLWHGRPHKKAKNGVHLN